LTEINSIWNPEARYKAVNLMKNGAPIGIFNRGVCAIWGQGENEVFINEILRIKGEKRLNRPLGATFLAEKFIPLVDKGHLTFSNSLFANEEDLVSRIGSLCFIRAPLKKSDLSNVPDSLISKSKDGIPIIQNWLPEGHRPTFLLVKLMHKLGIRCPAVTSMNISGQPEIVSQNEGILFSKDKNIPLFLYDPRDKELVKGSYTILGLTKGKVKLIRDGNIPGYLFDYLLETEIDRTRALPAKYKQPDFPFPLFRNLKPKELRYAIIGYLRGFEVQQILHYFRPDTVMTT
jgi:hypothetical protein